MQLQQLEPVSARLCLSIEKICKTRLKIPKGAKLLLAVSGGADSMALALIFQILAPRLHFCLHVAHINHQLRQEAGGDAEFVAEFCERSQIPCNIVVAEVRQLADSGHYGLEEAGRRLRQKIFTQLRSDVKADHIVTAHHAGDLCEDILMRLTRGCGWPALGGMAWKTGYIIRPFLHTDPGQLRAFLVACGQSWREDKSNQSLSFTRNRFRHILLPLLRCENPGIERVLPRLHDLAAIDADYWHSELEKALEAIPWEINEREASVEVRLPAALLVPLHPAARLRLYHLALAQLRGNGQTRADTLQRLERAWQNGIGGKKLQCSGGITANCSKAGITFLKTFNTAKSSMRPER